MTAVPYTAAATERAGQHTSGINHDDARPAASVANALEGGADLRPTRGTSASGHRRHPASHRWRSPKARDCPPLALPRGKTLSRPPTWNPSPVDSTRKSELLLKGVTELSNPWMIPAALLGLTSRRRPCPAMLLQQANGSGEADVSDEGGHQRRAQAAAACGGPHACAGAGEWEGKYNQHSRSTARTASTKLQVELTVRRPCAARTRAASEEATERCWLMPTTWRSEGSIKRC